MSKDDAHELRKQQKFGLFCDSAFKKDQPPLLQITEDRMVSYFFPDAPSQDEEVGQLNADNKISGDLEGMVFEYMRVGNELHVYLSADRESVSDKSMSIYVISSEAEGRQHLKAQKSCPSHEEFQLSDQEKLERQKKRENPSEQVPKRKKTRAEREQKEKARKEAERIAAAESEAANQTFFTELDQKKLVFETESFNGRSGYDIRKDRKDREASDLIYLRSLSIRGTSVTAEMTDDSTAPAQIRIRVKDGKPYLAIHVFQTSVHGADAKGTFEVRDGRLIITESYISTDHVKTKTKDRVVKSEAVWIYTFHIEPLK